jgi:hypothetical protein
MTAPTDRPDPPPVGPDKPAPGGEVGGKAAPDRGAAGATSNDEDDEWRHEPIAPIDEGNPLRSLGNAVGDAVTGSGADSSAPTPTPTPKPTKRR